MISKLSILLLAVLATLANGAQGEEYFTAAVFESGYFQNISAETKEEVVPYNLNVFKKAVETAASKGVDIIVFHEYGLFPYKNNRTYVTRFTEHIPDPKVVKSNPCEERADYQNRIILYTLSCLAKTHRLYLVADIGDEQPCIKTPQQASCPRDDTSGCNPCPENDKRIYNTAIAFDREGTIVARYHKDHLYFEMMNTPKPFDIGVFDTDFGKMGLMICFDSVFKEVIGYIKEYDFDTFIFPTYWFDNVYPMNAVEWQQAFAMTNKINFVGANAHVPTTASLGSGIYSRDRGALAYTYNPDGQSRLLIARLPRKGVQTPTQDVVYRYVITEDKVYEEQSEGGEAFPATSCGDVDGSPLLSDPSPGGPYKCYKNHFVNYTLSKLEEASGTVKACRSGVCCTVTYSANKMDEKYYVAVNNYTDNVLGYNGYSWAEEDCFVIRCDPKSGTLCAVLPSRSSTVFHDIEIRATFTQSAYVYATASTERYRLVPTSDYQVQKDGEDTVLTYKSQSNATFLRAGMIARAYERDPPYIPYYPFY